MLLVKLIDVLEKAPAGAPVTALEKLAEVPVKFPVKVSVVVDNVPLNVLSPAMV